VLAIFRRVERVYCRRFKVVSTRDGVDDFVRLSSRFKALHLYLADW